MKVFIDASTVERGGMVTFAENLLRELVKIRPRWAFSGIAPPIVARDIGVDWRVMSSKPSSLERLVSQQVWAGRLARRSGADVGLSLGPIIPLFNRTAKWIEVVHDLRHKVQPEEFGLLQRAYREVLYRASLRGSQAVVAVSEHTLGELESRYPFMQEGAVKVIVHGGDHVLGAGPKDVHDPYVIAYGHWRNKRPSLAVEVWAAAKKAGCPEGWTLKILGVPSEEEAALDRLASDLGVNSSVQINTYLPQSEFELIRRQASVQLLTSTYEGFGLPVLEGLRSRQVVFATEKVGMEEAGGTAAQFVRWDNVSTVGGTLARVLWDDELRQDLAARGSEHAASFTWSNAAEAYASLLEVVVNGV